MTIDSRFLYVVETDLCSLSRQLHQQETCARNVRRTTSEDVADAAEVWKGPRSTAVVNDAEAYLEAIKEYPKALESAGETIRRWATAAGDIAAAMARQERVFDEVFDNDQQFGESRPSPQDLEVAGDELDQLRAQWRRTCVTKGNELDGAIAAIRRANAATSIPVDPETAEYLATQLVLHQLAGPESMRDWWASLTDEQRLVLLSTDTGRLGGLDGVPAAIRDIANRTQLIDDLNRLEELELKGKLSDRDKRVLANIRNVVEQLEDGDKYRDKVSGQFVPCQLYIYEPAAFNGDGRVAISTGDLDAAQHMAVTVPGFTTNVAGMSNGDAQNLYDETRWASGGDGVAVLNWQAYDTPDMGGSWNPFSDELNDAGGVLSDVYADAGAQLLASDVAGLNGMRDDDPHVSVIAHSYGSTTAAIAANHYGLAADDVVLIGSPGAGYDNGGAGDLTTGDDHTWIGSASNDPVTYAPNLGPDPAEDGFGGTRFIAENNEGLTPVSDLPSHTAYYDPESESLYNIGSIAAGEYGDVVEAPDREPPVELHAPDIDIEPNHGPFGMPGFPSIDIEGPVELNPEYFNDPERDRDPGAMTHEPLQPGGPTHQGQPSWSND